MKLADMKDIKALVENHDKTVTVASVYAVISAGGYDIKISVGKFIFTAADVRFICSRTCADFVSTRLFSHFPVASMI